MLESDHWVENRGHEKAEFAAPREGAMPQAATPERLSGRVRHYVCGLAKNFSRAAT
jgi:hypothetical protein